MKINLRELRLKNNMTVRGLSELSGVDASTISRIENGMVIPSLLTVCKLCNALNVDMGDMVECASE